MAKSIKATIKPSLTSTEIKGRIAPSAPKPTTNQNVLKTGHEKLGRISPIPPKPKN
jgi:hypothetical protein